MEITIEGYLSRKLQDIMPEALVIKSISDDCKVEYYIEVRGKKEQSLGCTFNAAKQSVLALRKQSWAEKSAQDPKKKA